MQPRGATSRSLRCRARFRCWSRNSAGPLFWRERGRTHLTELGQMIRPHLETVFAAAVRAKQTSKELSQQKTVPLKLGIMSTISPDEIVDLIGTLESKYPGLELKLSDADAKTLRARLIEGELECVIYALPGEEVDDRTHVMPLFAEQMVIVVNRTHALANAKAFPVKKLDGERYIHRQNCEFAGYADHILMEQGVTCTPSYWSERDGWTLAMVAAGLGFAFMPINAVKHPDVVGVPVVEPEFWRQVNLVTVRGRPHSVGVGALVRESMRKKWFGQTAMGAAAESTDKRASA